MDYLLNNAFFPIFAVVAFVAVVLFAEALYLMWNTYRGPEARKIEQRLRTLSAGAGRAEMAAVLKNRTLSSNPIFARLFLLIPRVSQLDRLLLQSGMNWTVGKLLSVSLLSGLTIYIALFVGRFPASLQWGLAFLGAFMPWIVVQWKRSNRLHKIEMQLPDCLDLIGRALRAGHALPSCLKMAGDEMSDPIASEFRLVHDEVNFGVSMQQALIDLSERVPTTDIRYFVVAVLIQREAGGNLTEVLDNLSRLVRNRLKFQGKVRVLTTEGRMSAWVLGLLPFALAALLSVTNYEFISVLWTDPAGIKITQTMLTIMAVGAVWLYKVIQIRV
jgi:tight adherence protein B